MNTNINAPVSRRRYVCDVESNGLLNEATRIHCAVLYDIDTDEIMGFRPGELGAFLKLYQGAELIVGHNFIGFDAPLIKKLYGITIDPSKIIDTMVLGRLVFSDIKGLDFPLAKAWKKFKEAREAWDAQREQQLADDPEAEDPGPYRAIAPKEFPGQFVGAHGLEAWGYRIGAEKKGDYSKEMKAKGLDPWADFNEAMFEYMLQDARVSVGVLRYLLDQEPTELSIELEMAVQTLCSQMERNGWPFDVKAGQALYATLAQRRHQLEQEIVERFPPWRVRLDDFIPARNNKTKGYIAGVAVERWETREFNPASRDHIADRLIAKYGWKPKEFTEGGQPKVDDDILQALPYPEAKLLAEFFTVQKRIGQLAEGNQAWLKQVTKEGKIHARYNTNGAVTGRATHSNPNIAQVPSVGAEYGRDCRALFCVLPGWKQLGADQSGLELRCLGSFLSVFDGGAYIDVVLNGDIHWENAKALFGLPEETKRDPHDDRHSKMRNVAKTFIYAFLYGAGDGKLGSIIGKGVKAGAQLRARFLKRFPALKKLVEFVKNAAKKGWLKGLDGRKLPVRSEHAALNTLLQSAGALICKRWIVLADQMLQEAGLKHGWDGDYVFLGFIHDEAQLSVRPDVAEQVAAIIVEAGRHAGDIFPSWKCPTDVETKLGDNWADCH